MKAMQINDRCYSTLNGGHNPFNFDGEERTELSVEMARSAVDFEIEKKPCYDGDGRLINGLFHLTKSDDNSIVPSAGVGLKFKPIQHRDVFDKVMEEIVPQFPDMTLETAGTLYGGGIGLFTFRVGDLFHVKGDKSPNEMRLFISNPCTGSGSLVMGFTTVRLFCQNQIAAARRGAAKDGYRIQHSKNGEMYMGDAVKEIGIQVAAAKEIKLRSERLASLGVGKAALDKCLDLIYPFGKLEEGSAGYTRMLKLREEVVNQFESGATAQTMDGKTGWTLFNSFTYPVFNPERLNEKTDLANIQYDSMMWSKAEKVRRMLTAVESVVAA